jgi:hypothetical protein
MIFRHPWRVVSVVFILALAAIELHAQTPAQSPSSSSSKHSTKPASHADSELDPGSVANGVYHNKSLALACNIPEGWVLRTDELNAREEEPAPPANENQPEKDKAAAPASSAGAKVLLAAFSRPPQAKGEEINASILIAAESAAAYPGLKEAAQYFGPLIEVAKSQGFTLEEDPYDIAVGTKTLVRADFHKDVGSRVMHQSTLAMLVHGYAISITVIAGTEDDVEDLIDGLSFTAPPK